MFVGIVTIFSVCWMS